MTTRRQIPIYKRIIAGLYFEKMPLNVCRAVPSLLFDPVECFKLS